MFDASSIKKDFPIFQRTINGHPLVYLDSGATSQKPNQVIDAMNDFFRKHNANVHRGIYALSEEATVLYEGAREKIAKFINAGSTDEIIFTRNASESINLVALSWARQNLKEGDEIVTTEMEHHSNIVPWQMLAKERGVTLKYIPADPQNGTLLIDEAQKLISEKTKLVCVGHMSNLLGTVNPVEKIVTVAHQAGAKALIDGCQAVPHMPVDVQKIGADFYAFSGHKMLGPSGIGVLWAKKAILESTEPVLGGGDMIKTVSLEGATWNDIPWKFEAGTPNIVGAIGLGAAVEYLSVIGMKNVWKHELEISGYVIPKLKAMKGVTLFGVQDPGKTRGAIFSFWIDGMHPHDIASIFDEEGIAIRAGHMCAQPMLQKIGKPAAARASFYLYNTKEDADSFLGAIEKAKTVFGV